MEDSFFEFHSHLPPKLNVVSKDKFGDAISQDVEEAEYDAFNDETFGMGATDGDWEENHEKISEIIDKTKSFIDGEQSPTSLYFSESLLECEESQNEIVNKSISQLGLEDDLDDPAIMTVGRTQSTSRSLRDAFGPSPPPPAILDSEFCGSPKTLSIWSNTHSSTPVKDSGIGSILQSITHNSNIPSYQNSSSPLTSISGDVLHSPHPSKAWTVEELEKDLQFSNHSPPLPMSKSEWPSVSTLHYQCKQLAMDVTDKSVKDKDITSHDFWDPPYSTRDCKESFADKERDRWMSCSTPPPLSMGVRTLVDVEKDILLKPRARMVDDVEKNLQSFNNIAPKSYGFVESYLKFQQRQNFISPIKIPENIASIPTPSSAIQMPLTGKVPQLPLMGVPRHQQFVNNHPMMKTLQGMPNAFPGWQHNALYSQQPRATPLRYGQYRWSTPQPGDVSLDSLHANHPYLQMQRQLPQNPNYSRIQSNTYHDENKMSFQEDEYSGLMTPKEKDWLLRIQMLLLQTDDPYNQDYYFTAYTANRLAKSSKTTCNGRGDEPKLLLPERTKPETKLYVPTHFEGSLGKLQAVSVNFPRKVLGISVSRPLEDEEGRVVTNQCLLKYRRLLLDIEEMYMYLLEIDDKEKRILALPDEAQIPHKEACMKLTQKIFSGLACESAAHDDNFLNIMSIRKGRSLASRSFRLFNKSQQVLFLTALLRHLPLILRKDQNDAILEQNWPILSGVIRLLSFDEVVKLGESLDNSNEVDDAVATNTTREKKPLVSAFKNKFGTSIVCSIVQRAEDLYSISESLESEVQSKWARVVLHVVDVLCLLPDNCIMSPCVPYSDLLTHFQRFAVDRDKFEILKEKVTFFSH